MYCNEFFRPIFLYLRVHRSAAEEQRRSMLVAVMMPEARERREYCLQSVHNETGSL